MSNYAGIAGSYTAHKKWNTRTNKVLKVTPHHCAGNMTFEGMKAAHNAARDFSVNYFIDSQGKVYLFVDEQYRAWTSSNKANDMQAVTIEVANIKGAPNWEISDAAYASLINLTEDICRRNGIAKLNFTGNANGNLTQHNYFSATVCPGPYLKSKFPEIASTVNARLGGPSPSAPDEDQWYIDNSSGGGLRYVKVGPASLGDVATIRNLVVPKANELGLPVIIEDA